MTFSRCTTHTLPIETPSSSCPAKEEYRTPNKMAKNHLIIALTIHRSQYMTQMNVRFIILYKQWKYTQCCSGMRFMIHASGRN